MTTEQVASMVDEFGVPSAYYQFREGTGQQPPFVCFFYSGDNDMKADDSNYAKIERLVIEVYTATKNLTLESTVESVLASYGFVWERDETYLGDESMFEIIYQMDVVLTPEENTEG